MPARRPGVLAYRLIYDYTVGFALGDSATPGEQQLRDAQTSHHLLAFRPRLPGDRFPVLAIGEQVWTSDRDERFTQGMNAIRRPAGPVRTSLAYPARSTRRYRNSIPELSC